MLDRKSWEFFFQVQRTIILAGCVEELADVAIKSGEGALEIGGAGWVFADGDFLERKFVFREPFGGFAAGVAGFESVNAEHEMTLDLEIPERNRDFQSRPCERDISG